MKFFTFGFIALCMLVRGAAAQTDPSADANQQFMLRLTALALSSSVRAMCDDAPASVRAKLEARLKSMKLDQLDADDLCRDDACLAMSGALPGKPNKAELSAMIAGFRAEQVANQKRLPTEQRLANCTKFMSLLERVKSSNLEQIMLEMEHIGAADEGQH